VSRPRSGERSERSLDATEHSAQSNVGATAYPRESAITNTSHDPGAGALHCGVVDAVFDVAMSVPLPMAMGRAFRLGCPRSTRWIRHDSRASQRENMGRSASQAPTPTSWA